jgi:hypothetical protein
MGEVPLVVNLPRQLYILIHTLKSQHVMPQQVSDGMVAASRNSILMYV